MTDAQKIKCPACAQLVSAQMPNCPFCTQALPPQSRVKLNTRVVATDAAEEEAASTMGELAMAKEALRQSQPTFTDTVIVTGPISGLMSLVKPAYGSGVVQLIEIVLAVLALPAIVIGVGLTALGVRRWGQIPMFSVAFPAGLVTLVAWKMQAPVGFPVLMVSLVAFGIKALIGGTARVRKVSR